MISAISDSGQAVAGTSFWGRRIVGPILGQMRQGITADKIAVSIALGFVLATFPILGSTILLCALAGFLFKLNQPVIQTVNFLAYPAQVALLIPFYRAGETLFRHPHIPLSIPLLIGRFQTDALQFLKDFGLIALQGIVVWLLLSPFLAATIFCMVRPVLRTLERKLAS